MAFNSSPKVAIARDFAKKFSKKMVIIFSTDDNNLEYVSYGDTKALCDNAKRLADEAFESIMNTW